MYAVFGVYLLYLALTPALQPFAVPAPAASVCPSRAVHHTGCLRRGSGTSRRFFLCRLL